MKMDDLEVGVSLFQGHLQTPPVLQEQGAFRPPFWGQHWLISGTASHLWKLMCQWWIFHRCTLPTSDWLFAMIHPCEAASYICIPHVPSAQCPWVFLEQHMDHRGKHPKITMSKIIPNHPKNHPKSSKNHSKSSNITMSTLRLIAVLIFFARWKSPSPRSCFVARPCRGNSPPSSCQPQRRRRWAPCLGFHAWRDGCEM